jgi:hypothetical protein
VDSNKPSDRDKQAGIGSAEYRAKLLTKLNCLMAVLEVAITKVGRSMELPAANQERLSKIRTNLENTLSICARAKETLERSAGAPASSTPKLADPRKSRNHSMSYRDYVELSSIDEYQKFKNLPPIDSTEIATTDIDDVLRRLYES